MALATSYNVDGVKGARENLENLLKTVEPTETPLYSTLSQSAAPKATLNEWLVDSLADPAGAGGNIDGADLDLSTAQNLIDSALVLLTVWQLSATILQSPVRLKWSMLLLVDLCLPLPRLNL